MWRNEGSLLQAVLGLYFKDPGSNFGQDTDTMQQQRARKLRQ
jgi:hypothetical protein